jgi:hypothetical protein
VREDIAFALYGLKVIVSITVLAAASCGGVPQPSPVPVGDSCERAQENLDEMYCPERKTAAGVPFRVVCYDLASQGYPPPAECVAHAASCDEARACR